MPSKIQDDIVEGGSDEEMMPMGYPDMPERKEYLWSCDLEGAKAQFKFEGGDSETETITFKSAALGEGATGKHVVKVSAVGANSEKVTATLCVLNDQNCWLRLPELSIEPPLLLSLAEGTGPVNICANHLLEEDPEEDDEEDEAEEEDIAEVAAPPAKKAAPAKKETPEKKPEEKKRKADDTEKESPANKKAKADKKDKKNRNYTTIEDVKKAIIANPGGKPKKEEKFGNWVKNTMKCTNEDWIKDLWTWHKTENNL